MFKKFLKCSCVLGLSFVLISSSALAVTGKVTGTTVRIREKPTSNSLEISAATKGEKVEVIGDEGNWYKVKFENVTGYISKDYVDTDYVSGSNSSEETEQEPEATQEEPSSEPIETSSEQPQEEPTQEQTPENTSSESESVQEEPAFETPSEEEQSRTETVKIEVNEEFTFSRDVELRFLPNFSSRTIVKAENGSNYTIKEILNYWVKVSNDTNIGWVLKSEIEGTSVVAETPLSELIQDNQIQEEPTPEPVQEDQQQENNGTTQEIKKGKVNVESARLRKSPNGEALDSIKEGTIVEILGEEDDWYHIKTDDYDSCYIAKRLITEL